MIEILHNAETKFNFDNPKHGILFLHGFTGNPAEFKYLVKMAENISFSYLLPRYPGHGTSIYEMLNTDRNDWYTCAREAYIELNSRCENIYIVGHSMGACFAGNLAYEFNPKKIVLISMPYELKDWRLRFTSLISKFIKILPADNSASAILDPEESKKHKGYSEGTPVKQVGDLLKIINYTRKILPKVKTPTLLIQSSKDSAVGENAIDSIFEKIGSDKKSKSVYHNSEHVIMMDYDKDEVIKKISDFLTSE